MANWSGTARTNGFRVKDPEKFEEDIGGLNGIEIIGEEAEEGMFFKIIVTGNDGDFPTMRYGDEYEDGETQISIAEEVSKHLIDGDVAIFMEVGAEKLRYVSGWSCAINSKGESRVVNLNDIYEKAKELGENITDASY